MKKSLKLVDNHFLNMDSIIEWKYDKESVTISTSLTTEDNGIYLATEESQYGVYRYQLIVPVQEIKRVIREISEYME